jgi:hypothetical protein
VPIDRFDGTVQTETAAGAVPDAVDTLSQFELAEALHESVPALEFVMDTAWAAGAGPPMV